MSHRVADGSPGRATSVWIVNHYAVAPDRPAAAGSRHFDLARSLVARGYIVTIVAAGRSHLSGREERVRFGRLYRTGSFDGVRFVWLATFPYHGNTWRRPINMLSFVAAFLVVQSRLQRPDVIVGSTVHPFAALAAWLVARVRRSTFELEIRDLWPQTLVDIGALRPGSVGERMLRMIEAFLVRRASVVITLLPGMRDYLDVQGLPSGHVVYIPNGVDMAAFDADGRTRSLPPSAFAEPEAVDRSLEVVARMKREGRFVLGYTGTLGRVNRVDVLVEAAAIAEQQAPGRIGLIIVGDGPEREQLALLAEGLPPVAFAPAVPKGFVPEILRAVDAGVVHATATPVYRYGISFNKLFEYMAAGRPIVFACDSAYDPVQKTGAGVTVAPADPHAIASAFLALSDASPEERSAMGEAGHRYVEREHNLEQLGEAFEAAIAGGPRA